MPSPRPTLALLLTVAVALAVGVVMTPSPAASRSSGAPPGFAGNAARTDGTAVTCTSCHSSFELNAGPGVVTVEAPATAAPGERVPITVALDAAALPAEGRQGFEATVRDPLTGDLWGTLHLTDAVDTQYATGDKGYVTHTTSGTARGTWAFEWEPGAEATGTARVYVAANAANNDGGTGGDYIYSATADVVVAPTDGEARPEVAFEVSPPRPHPARAGGSVALSVTLDRPGALRVLLVDGLGRVVRRVADGERAAGVARVRLETAGLAAGVYGVVVEGPGGRLTRPLVLVR